MEYIKNKSRKLILSTDIVIKLISVLSLAFLMTTSSLIASSSIASICAQGLMFLNLMLLAMYILNNPRFVKISFILFILLILSFTVSFYISNNQNVIKFLINLCSYISVPVYMLVIPTIKINSSTIKWLKKISVCYTLFFIISYLVKPSVLAATGAVTLGYSNANTAGMYMYLTSMLLILSFQNSEKKVEQMLSFILVVVLSFLIIQTQCRTAFLLTLFCLLNAIFPKIFRPQRKFALFCVLFPLIFYYLYSFLYQISWNLDFTILGRTIYSGRQDMFTLEGINFSLFGNYVDPFLGLNVAQIILNALGIVGFTLFYIYCIRFMLSPFIQKQNRDTGKTNLKLICMGTMFLYGCVESAMFTSGSVFASLIGCTIVAAQGINNS